MFPLAMLLGGLLTVAGVLAPERVAPEPAAIVRVNGTPLPADDLIGGLAEAFDADGNLDPAKAAKLLDQVVLEEVVYQQGVALGVPRSDSIVRRRIVEIVRSTAVNEARAVEPSEAELRAYYQAHRADFALGRSYRVAEIFLSGGERDRTQEIREIHELLRGGADFDALARQRSDPSPVELRAAPVGIAEIERQLGPGYATVVRGLGSVPHSAPIATRFGQHLVRIEEEVPGQPRSFEEAGPAVLSLVRREAGKRALAAYLDRLLAETDVWVAPDAFAQLSDLARLRARELAGRR